MTETPSPQRCEFFNYQNRDTRGDAKPEFGCRETPYVFAAVDGREDHVCFDHAKHILMDAVPPGRVVVVRTPDAVPR